VSEKIIAARGIYAIIARSVRAISTTHVVNGVLHRVILRPPSVEPSGGHQLQPFEHRTFSQHGEDGILKELCFRLGMRQGYFVEFGVQDGSECNTALFARLYDWSGLYIEPDRTNYALLEARFAGNSGVGTANVFLTAENIESVFQENNVPRDFDILSIDVDGNDFWLWRALRSYTPKIVAIEYNGAFPPPKKWVMKYAPDHVWDETSYFGASLASFVDLADAKGYAFVGTEACGVNAFFVRCDLLPLTRFRRLSAEEGYHRPHYGLTGIPYPYRQGEALEDQVAEACAHS
jgi:hypothetical protein